MRQEDLVRAVNTIHASAQLKDKVLNGKSSGYNKKTAVSIFFKSASCLAAALIFVLGFLFIPRILKPVGTVGAQNSVPPASEQAAAQNGLHDNNQVRNVLLLGMDDSGHNDCIMLLSIDHRKESERLILTPFPRDLYVEIPGYGKNKLNTAYQSGGAELSVKALNKNFNMEIDDYIVIDYNGLTKIIDRLDGVRLNLTESEAKLVNQYSGESGKHLTAGDSLLTGKQALYFSRIRSIDSDLQRMQREQAVLAGMIDQFKLLDIGSITKLAQGALPLLKTNMDKNTVLALASDAFASKDFPISYFRPSEDLFDSKQVQIQGSSVYVLTRDLKTYSDSIYRFIYQNDSNAS